MTWSQDLIQRYQSGTHHAFILTGNVRDAGENDVQRTLKLLAERNFKLSLFWDKAAGLMLLGDPEAAARFRKTYLTVETPFGVQEIAPESLTASDQAFGIMSRFLSTETEKALVVIDYADSALPDDRMSVLQEQDRKAVVISQIWGRSDAIGGKGHMVVLIANTLQALHQNVRSAAAHYHVVRVPYPSHEERERFAKRCETPYEMSVREFANMTSGLNYLQLEDIFLEAKKNGGVTRSLIKQVKDAVISSEFAEVLEPMYPGRGFEIVGGLDHVKRFFVDNVIEPMRVGNYTRVPMGVLMTGPAGTGKTIMAEAVAYEAKINAVKLNLAKVFGRYVGDSERNLERAWEGILSMAPTIVFIDEIDQQVRRGESGDSGVSNRVFSRLLEVMSDTYHRGKVIFLAATNRPDLMDPAMKRPGRFDKKVPFFPPSTIEERGSIVEAFVNKYDRVCSPQAHARLARATEGWTGAEIEGLYLKALELTPENCLIDTPQVDEAVSLYIPTTSAIEYMTEVALAEVNDLSLVPEEYHTRVRALHNKRETNEAS